MPQRIHPIPTTNAKFNAYAAMHEAEKAVAERVGELDKTLGTIAYRLERLCDRFPEREDWGTLTKRDGHSAEDIDRLCAAIERRDRSQVNNVAALCAAGFSVTGDIDGSTRVGKWLQKAGEPLKITHLRDIARLTGQMQRRPSFIRNLLDTGPSFAGLPARMTQDEIDHFIDLSPSLLAAMRPAGDEDETPEQPDDAA